MRRPSSSKPSGPRPPRKPFRERWADMRKALPHVWAIARPQLPLWSIGLALMLVNRAAGLVLPAMPKYLLDVVLPAADRVLLAKLIAIVVGATVIQGITSFILTQTISKAGQRLMARLREQLQQHVLRLPVRYFDDRRSGEVASRVLNDVDGVRVLVGTGMIEFLGGILTATFAFAILFWLNWQLTLAILGFVLILGGVLAASFMRLGPLFRLRQEQLGDLQGRLNESLGGIRVVKAYRTEEIEEGVFSTGVRALLGSILKTITAISFLALSLAVLLGGLGAVILWLGGGQLITGKMTAGEFVTYLLYLGFMIAPLSGTLMSGSLLSEAFAGVARIRETLGLGRETDGDEDRAAVGTIEGRVEFREVDFAYDPAKPVLRGVSFTASPGSVTAIVGPSGSGKSTLIGLIAGFHAPQGGEVLIDGKALSGLRLSDYRRHLGCVFQESFLFSASVRENIAYAAPKATEEQIKEAARLAHAAEFITTLPQGYDTVIGERGVKLSGGQRQRLSIARALLANPRILLLDEATSALDSESEEAVQMGLKTLMQGRTTFVIAHRLSTIRRADRILVVDEGRIVEQGTHGELLATRGRYFEMLRRQHDAEANRLFASPDDGESEEDEETKSSRTERTDRLHRLMTGE